MGTTRVEPMLIIEGRAIGELQGHGKWTIFTTMKLQELVTIGMLKQQKPG